MIYSELREIEEEIRECDRKIKELKVSQEVAEQKLKQLIKSNSDEYKRYEEYELKRRCLLLKQQKVGNKEIATQLKKNASWVKKTLKLKQNQIKKPSGNVVKEMEQLQKQILIFKKQIEEKQAQLQQARERYDNL